MCLDIIINLKKIKFIFSPIIYKFKGNRLPSKCTWKIDRYEYSVRLLNNCPTSAFKKKKVPSSLYVRKILKRYITRVECWRYTHFPILKIGRKEDDKKKSLQGLQCTNCYTPCTRNWIVKFFSDIIQNRVADGKWKQY